MGASDYDRAVTVRDGSTWCELRPLGSFSRWAPFALAFVSCASDPGEGTSASEPEPERDEPVRSAAEAAGLDVCESSDDCSGSEHCLPTSEQRFEDESVCAPGCDQDADCSSGCCGRLDTGQELCGFPADCGPAPIGNPCLSDRDCDSEDCRWGSCVERCDSDADCGNNLLGLPNRCYRETGADGDVESACLPGCNDDFDCRFYFEDPYYSLNRELEPIPLRCVDDADGSYCL